MKTAPSFFRIHTVSISLNTCPFEPPRDEPMLVEIADPIGGALYILLNAIASGHHGEHVDRKGDGRPSELSSSQGMRDIRATVPEGAMALILDFYSDKSDINAP